MKGKRTTKMLALLAAMMLGGWWTAAQGQRFEWAKGYGSAQEGCVVKGSVTDGEGNLYILGKFRNDSEWDGQRLLPMAPYGPYHNNINVLIAKISPEGDMVWKKVIHSNNGQNSLPWDIKKLGDTAFACLVQFSFPADDINYTYWLDTLIPGWSDYPFPCRGLTFGISNALIVFDFEGNVIERHMLNITYVDNEGNNVCLGDSNEIINNVLYNPTFDIDREGNVYICRRANETIGGCDSCIGGIKFWVDRRLAGYVDRTGQHPQHWYPQLLKFSSHLDTLLDSRYVVQKCDTTIKTANLESSFLRLDENANVYYAGTIQNRGYGTIFLDTLNNLEIKADSFDYYLGYVVKFDSMLIPHYCLHLQDSIIGDIPLESSGTHFFSLGFDADSGLLFVSGFAQKNRDANSMYTINGEPFGLEKNDAFVLLVDKNVGSLHSACIIPSESSSNIGLSDPIDNLAIHNNRVFIQTQYYGGITLGGTEYGTPHEAQPGLGLAIFDYQGNSIGGIDYQSYDPRNRPGSISVHDSVIFLGGVLEFNALFGDIDFLLDGYVSVYVAKYVDTAFLTPYTAPIVKIEASENDSVFALSPNPAQDLLFVDTGEETIESMNAISMYGLTIPLRQQGRQIDISCLKSGIYLLEIKTNRNKYYQKFIKL